MAIKQFSRTIYTFITNIIYDIITAKGEQFSLILLAKKELLGNTLNYIYI